jgi:uncharacterized Tic20 family protein
LNVPLLYLMKSYWMFISFILWNLIECSSPLSFYLQISAKVIYFECAFVQCHYCSSCKYELWRQVSLLQILKTWITNAEHYASCTIQTNEALNYQGESCGWAVRPLTKVLIVACTICSTCCFTRVISFLKFFFLISPPAIYWYPLFLLHFDVCNYIASVFMIHSAVFTTQLTEQ